MEEFENRQKLPVLSEVVEFDAPPQEAEVSPLELLIPVLRRWYIVLFVFLIVAGGGLTATYFLMGQKYETNASIHVSSTETPIMYDTEGRLPPYDMFKNTQAAIIGGDDCLNRAADELQDKNIIFFEPGVDIHSELRKLVMDGKITIEPVRDNEFINIQMVTDYPSQAEDVINAILRGYTSIVVSEETEGDNVKLRALEKRKGILEDQIETQQLQLRQRAQEYGTDELDSRQQIMLDTVATIQEELIAISIRRIMLETQVQMKRKMTEEELTVEDLATQQNEVVEQDPIVASLRQDVHEYQELVREARTIMKEDNPELQRLTGVLTDLERQLEKRRTEVSEEVEAEIKKEIIRGRERELAQAEAEKEQTIDYENRLKAELDQYDSETIGLGRKQFEIEDYQEQLEQTKEIYNDVCRRIEELNIEQSRQPRIKVNSYAWSVEAKGKRRKMVLASAMGGMALGVFIAFIMGKIDNRLYEPQEVTKRIGVRIIGTTTSPEDVDKKLLPQQLMDDYQTIRANIGLMEDSDNTNIMVVTSPGMADGKTTFSINLATSFAQSGYKTLLIDADLRKPDIARALKLPAGQRGFQDYLFGLEIDKAVYKSDSMDFYILASDNRNTSDALTILSHPQIKKRIKKLRESFDKIIIDTPPVLAFSDALVLARMADGVLLTSFVGHTSTVEIREAAQRLHEIDARILGTVVNNVKVSHSYRRYGYGYGYDYGRSSKQKQKERKKKNMPVLLITEGQETIDS